MKLRLQLKQSDPLIYNVNILCTAHHHYNTYWSIGSIICTKKFKLYIQSHKNYNETTDSEQMIKITNKEQSEHITHLQEIRRHRNEIKISLFITI